MGHMCNSLDVLRPVSKHLKVSIEYRSVLSPLLEVL